jgi:hypothetical protein
LRLVDQKRSQNDLYGENCFQKRKKAILYELSPLKKIQQIFAKSEVEKTTKNFKEMKQPEENHYVLAQKG